MFDTFWLELTDRERRWLRRYRSTDDGCPAMEGEYTYHQAKVAIEDGPLVLSTREGDARPSHVSPHPGDPAFCHDERWREIAQCACGYTFTRGDSFQVHTQAIYRRVDTGEELILADAPVGALWDAWWMGGRARGDDGLSATCVLPGGHQWHIDGQANNCTRPGEAHHCWVRHGSFGERLTVDKIGNTCAAGGGSIWVHKPVEWHGFLRDGFLKEVGEV